MVKAIINIPDDFCNPLSEYSSNAANLSPTERKAISVEALAGSSTVTEIAARNNVSRKFAHKQKNIANKALDKAFEPIPKDDDVIFYLPVTKKWIRQFVLALILICHSSFRGVIELLGSLFDYHNICLGTIHNIVVDASKTAAAINGSEDLSNIRYAAPDEIFQNSKPVLAGLDLESTYCYLLSAEDHRDETTWGVHLLDLRERGLHPVYTVADGGKGLRAGQSAAWPDVPCHGDVFHAEYELGKLVTFLENRAASALTKLEKIQAKMFTAKTRKQGTKFSKSLALARQNEEKISLLADEIRTLSDWMRDDVLSLAGPDLESRRELFDFIVEEIEKREDQFLYKIRPVRIGLKNQRDVLLGFVSELEKQFIDISQQLDVPIHFVHAVCELQALNQEDSPYWVQKATLQKKLGHNFFPIYQAVQESLANTPRASSLVENLNSRLRNYFFLRRHIGNRYLELLQFFLNHRKFMRSECPERAGLSPYEIMTGKIQPHWLESLGFNRFQRA